MASYLNNTADIILDAVLTDYGRQLLAKGDGSFNIVKFAFGDDEIDYSLFNASATSPNQDTLLMSTPILEAFTNNVASVQSKLVTVKQENLLFLPVLKINNIDSNNKSGSFPSTSTLYNGFVVPVDPSGDSTSLANASNFLTTSTSDSTPLAGVLTGRSRMIRVDQGLDSSKLNNKESLEVILPELYETEYNIMIDSRFGKIEGLGEPLAVDDDYTATYRVTTNSGMVRQIPLENPNLSPIRGTKGTFLAFTITPTMELKTSDVYFTTYGNSSVGLTTTKNFKTIRTSVEVMGIKTGYSLEIPVLYAKI